jgi:hypothetical protein
MKKLFVITFSALTTTAFCSAKNPVGDWQAVRFDIPQGWQITVVTSFTFPCIFESATEDELICGPLQRPQRTSASHETHIRRDRVREIRVERRDGANMLAGATGAGGLGAGLGAIAAAGSRGSSAYALGLLGAGMGARTGRGLHILRGKVIYRRL